MELYSWIIEPPIYNLSRRSSCCCSSDPLWNFIYWQNPNIASFSLCFCVFPLSLLKLEALCCFPTIRLQILSLSLPSAAAVPSPARRGGGAVTPQCSCSVDLSPFRSVSLKQALARGNSWHNFMEAVGEKGEAGGRRGLVLFLSPPPLCSPLQIIPAAWPRGRSPWARWRLTAGIDNISAEGIKLDKAGSGGHPETKTLETRAKSWPLTSQANSVFGACLNSPDIVCLGAWSFFFFWGGSVLSPPAEVVKVWALRRSRLAAAASLANADSSFLVFPVKQSLSAGKFSNPAAVRAPGLLSQSVWLMGLFSGLVHVWNRINAVATPVARRTCLKEKKKEAKMPHLRDWEEKKKQLFSSGIRRARACLSSFHQ